jgi:hypothetical protein
MASTRTAARVLAAMAALPLAFTFFVGTAAADNGALANKGSSATVVSNSGGNVRGGNFGNSTTTQQVANGAGASNQANTASVRGSGFTQIKQTTVNVYFTRLW